MTRALLCETVTGDTLADLLDARDAAVVIAGFGRFGQIVGRLLLASGIRATVLDHDPDNIDLLRRLGFRVFYGDGTRLDLLTAAGAGEARVLINAIDDMAGSLKLVDVAQQYFPELPLVARARDVTHWRELRERGVIAIERETFESALRAINGSECRWDSNSALVMGVPMRSWGTYCAQGPLAPPGRQTTVCASSPRWYFCAMLTSVAGLIVPAWPSQPNCR
jgi:hypothetical protein